MNDTLKLFILAGEPSGDHIAADLVGRLKQRVTLALSGVGGDELSAQGLHSSFPMSDLSVMGVSDVIKRLPLLLWRIEQTARAIRKQQPDIVVLVDSQDFSALLARRLSSMGYDRPVVLYVAPSVWARHPERAAKLKPLFAEVLAVLPFEPKVMAQLGGPLTSYVGHPAAANLPQPNAVPDTGPIVLLPGSRDGELRRHMPMLREVATRLSGRPEVTGFVLPTLGSLAERLRQETVDWPVPVTVVAERAARAEVYQTALLALAVSGTVTLEIALARLPMVVTYVMDATQARVYEKIGRPAIGLPNIVLGRAAVPELVLDKADADAMVSEAVALLDNKKARQDQVAAFGELVQMMVSGVPGTPRQDPADRILSHWNQLATGAL